MALVGVGDNVILQRGNWKYADKRYVDMQINKHWAKATNIVVNLRCRMNCLPYVNSTPMVLYF